MNICQCKYVNESLKLPANTNYAAGISRSFPCSLIIRLARTIVRSPRSSVRRSLETKPTLKFRSWHGLNGHLRPKNENIFSWVPFNRATWPSFKLKRLLWSIKTFNKQSLPTKNSHRGTSRFRTKHCLLSSPNYFLEVQISLWN